MSAVDTRCRMWRGPQVMRLDTHTPARGYVTRAPIPCASCGEIIAPGSTVTLHSVKRTGERGPGSNPPRPVCWHCRMFCLLDAPRILIAGA